MPPTPGSPITQALEEAEWLTATMPIRLFGDPILTQPCAAITDNEFATGQARLWASKLTDFMTVYRNHTGLGRGLAANQIGIAKQIIWIWTGSKAELFFNPRITAHDGRAEYPESCISGAALMIGVVQRPWSITVIYQDEHGQPTTHKYDGLMARLLQHEIDHLNGRICSDLYQPGTMRLATGNNADILKHDIQPLAER